jgi:GNAT superfamily N-acetyltransferase
MKPNQPGVKMQQADPAIHSLEQSHIPEMAEAFQQLGWHKPASQYERYLREQALEFRNVYVALVDGKFAGYLTICWTSTYPRFREAKIPEIVDFNVLPKFRRRGVGTALMDKAESEIAKVSHAAGIGVGMTPDYGAAQRMYVLRGYVPDGYGLYQRDHYPIHGEQVVINDDLAIFLTKLLK